MHSFGAGFFCLSPVKLLFLVKTSCLPIAEKPKQPKSLSEQFEEVIKEASQLATKMDRLRANPGFCELNLDAFALEIHLLAEAFGELSKQVGGEHG